MFFPAVVQAPVSVAPDFVPSSASQVLKLNDSVRPCPARTPVVYRVSVVKSEGKLHPIWSGCLCDVVAHLLPAMPLNSLHVAPERQHRG